MWSALNNKSSSSSSSSSAVAMLACYPGIDMRASIAILNNIVLLHSVLEFTVSMYNRAGERVKFSVN